MTFDEIMNKYLQLQAQGQEDTPEGIELMAEALAQAPKWLKDKLMVKAGAEGFFPKPYGHGDNGERYYRLDDIANHLGITIEEAEETLEKITKDRAAHGLTTDITPTGPIHRRH